MAEYTYRGKPCTAGHWFVAGLDRVNGSGGILEWCASEQDALDVMTRMNRGSRFTDLSVGLDE